MFWQGGGNGELFRSARLRQYTLRQFTRLHEAEAAVAGTSGLVELLAVQQVRLTVLSDGEAKEKLSELLAGGKLPAEQFYRLSPSGADEADRDGSACLDLSFYLFEDGRLCPLRIWSAAERFGSRAGGPAWTVDFNGIPPWSRVLACGPRWERCPGNRGTSSLATARFAGSSARNWAERDCWRVSGAL